MGKKKSLESSIRNLCITVQPTAFKEIKGV
uniref:Uncharacterized protein n=1 Tax=Anguilla anguilla TaxID=7936 RepID=A0A0E9UTQ2_ANGAN